MSSEMEWMVRRSWQCEADDASKTTSVSRAARGAFEYLIEMWEFEAEIPESQKKALAARLKGLTEMKEECDEEEFVELVRTNGGPFGKKATRSARVRSLELDFDAFRDKLSKLSMTTHPPLLHQQPKKSEVVSAQRSSRESGLARRKWERKRREREDAIEERLFKMREALSATSLHCLDPLTSEEESRVDEALEAGSNVVVSEGFNAQVLGSHASRLRPGAWLVDEVINFYFALLQERFQDCHFFNSFFVTKLCGQDGRGYDYPGVRRWTRKVDLFSKRKIFMPVNIGNMHWTVIVVDKTAVRYLDSLGDSGKRYLLSIQKYMEDEHRDKLNSPLAKPYDLRPSRSNDVPRQTNGYDCGVFAAFNAHYLAFDKEPSFTQDDIDHLRRRMLLSILDKAIV